MQGPAWKDENSILTLPTPPNTLARKPTKLNNELFPSELDRVHQQQEEVHPDNPPLFADEGQEEEHL